MKILYLHGWQSVPGGVKPTFLESHGHQILQPALPDEDFEPAVRVAQSELETHQPELVIGSSRGGAVAMALSAGSIPLLLLCPAWKAWGHTKTVKAGTVILHAPEDEVIPYADSLELLRNSGLERSALISVGNNHRLADTDSLRVMLAAVKRFAGGASV